MDKTGLITCIQEAACELKSSRSCKPYTGRLYVSKVTRLGVYLIDGRGYWAISGANGVMMGFSAL